MRAPVAAALRLGLALGALVAATPAAACETDLVDFGGAITTVQLSVTNGYADGAADVIDELHDNIECLRFAPPPNLWADWLFLVALTRHAQGRDDWRPPLDRALAINPNLSRGVIGSGHPLYSYEPGETKLSPTPLPYDKPYHSVYVDGLPVDNVLTEPNGLHLIQLNNGAWWDSMIVEGSSDDRDLWVAKTQPKTVRMWLYLVGGTGPADQVWTEPNTGAESRVSGLRYFGALRGQITVANVTFRGQLTPDETVEAPVFGVVGLDFDRFGFGLGAAGDRLDVKWDFRPDARRDARWYPDAVVAAWAQTDGVRHVDARVMGALTRQSANAGVWPQRTISTPVRYRLGLAVSRRGLALTDAAGTRYPMRSYYGGLEVAVQLFKREVEVSGSAADPEALP